MDLFANVVLGLETAFTPINLLYCFIGVFLGTLVGVIPGIGALSAISMLFPLTFTLSPTAALIMLAGIWYGTSYGGSTASILLNLPGTPANAVTCFDGYPMARKGRGGVALLMSAVGSFVGGSVGILLMMFFAPVIASYALSFGSQEYFALIVLGLVAASAISDGSTVKGLAMVTLGLLLGTIGLDIYTAQPRLTLGIIELGDGIHIVTLAMGLFGVAETISSVRSVDVRNVDKSMASFSAMKPTREEWRRSWGAMLRGSGVGSFFGTLPGVGPSVAAFVSYAVEKRVSRHPEEFGHGAIEGVVAPETANNASDQAAFIPTMTLGIPGGATMALMLGALLINGITPGPKFMYEHADIFWGLVMSFWVGNVLLVILNVPLIGLWVRLLLVPYHILYPIVMVFICIGVFSLNNLTFDLWIVALFGLVGYVLRLVDLPTAPVLLGFVLGPLLEEHFRRSMLLSRGDVMTFVERPISATVLAAAAALLIWSALGTLRMSRAKLAARAEANGGGSA